MLAVWTLSTCLIVQYGLCWALQAGVSQVPIKKGAPRQVLLTVHADGSLVAGVVAPAARTLSTLWSVSATGGPRGPAAQARSLHASLL